MGDGNFLKERNIIRIYTNSFTKLDVYFLSDVIFSNLGIINKVIHDRNNQYIIIIEKNYLNLTREIVFSYMHPSMLYKIGINSNSFLINKFNYFNIINEI